MASVDLSAAFDVIKRMKIMGIPDDIVKLVEVWHTERFFYVEIDNVSSFVMITWYGIMAESSVVKISLDRPDMRRMLMIRNLYFF